MTQAGFARHLGDAIVLNYSRLSLYADLTQDKSRLLSYLLISSEIFSLPVASYFDYRAKALNKRGVGVVQDDFVSMARVPDATKPPQHRKSLCQAQFEQLEKRLHAYQQGCFKLIKERNLFGLCQSSAEILRLLESCEQEQDVHLAMSHHLISSLAFAAHNGLGYAEQSKGKSLVLSCQLVAVQLRVLRQGLYLDQKAQAFHANNCGIIVNDVPEIPFPQSHYS